MERSAGRWSWERPEWREEAVNWAAEKLKRWGRRIEGPVEQPHLRPWSTVLRLPTNGGDVYLKAAISQLAYEVRLVPLLAERQPDLLPRVLGSDPDRGWLLMEGGGTPLRERMRPEVRLRHWRQLLPSYAGLQRRWEGAEEQLLQSGLPDRRLDRLPELVSELLAADQMLGVGQDWGLSQGELKDLGAQVKRLPELLEKMDRWRIAPTIDHGDFHDANILLAGEDYVFFDWGDASLTHPFFSLRTAFVSIENILGLEEGDPVFDELRDLYLTPWQAELPKSELREAFHMARSLWAIGAALRWRRALHACLPAEREPYLHAVPSLLRELLAGIRVLWIDGPMVWE